MDAIIWLVNTCFRLYFWILIAQVVMSWLIAFNVLNTHQPFVYQVGHALWRLTEPVLGPIRRILPNLGGLDFSPLVALIGIEFLRRIIIFSVLIPIATGRM